MPPRSIWRWALGLLAAGLVVIGLLVVVPRLAFPPLTEADLDGIADPERRIELRQAQAKLQDGVRTTILQVVAGFVIAIGAAATWWQVRVNREGHITEQRSRAVDQVGSANLDVQLGGIYGLERIAKASADDRITIMFMLGAFVRRHAPWPPDPGTPHPLPAVDMGIAWLGVRNPAVQAAMNVLSRRLADPRLARLNLTRTDLRSLQVEEGAQLANTIFSHANLARAWMRGAILDRGSFRDCDLRLANLAGASLVGADLRSAHLQGANLRGADLRDADLRGADLTGADLTDADVSGARIDGP